MIFFKDKEWRELFFVGVIIFVTIIFFNSNFLASKFVYYPEKQFSGIVGVSTIDYNVYFSMIEQARQGSFFSRNLYSTDYLKGNLVHPLWLFLGGVAKVFDLSSVDVYHWSKIYFGVGFLYFLYFLVRYFIFGTKWRLATMVGFGFFGGWGRWFSIPLLDYFQGSEIVRLLFGTDMWHNEGFVFLTLTHSSLFIVTQFFLIASWWLLLSKQRLVLALSGVCVFVLGLMHPYDILIFWSVIFVWSAFFYLGKKQQLNLFIKKMFWPLIATAALAIYYFLLILSNHNFSGWLNQNITLSPSFYSTLIGYGWLWFFSGFGLFCLFKNFDNLQNKYYWLLAWYLTLPILMFAPINFSRRMIHTFGVVVIIMSVIGARYLWNNFLRKKYQNNFLNIKTAVLTSFLALTLFISPLYQGIENFFVVAKGDWPAFVSSDRLDVAGWFVNTSKDSKILAQYFIGHLIPGQSGRFVYLGHPHQTVNFDQKYLLLERFFNTKWQEWKTNFLINEGVDYLVWPTEKKYNGPEWPIVYSNNSYMVYKVNQSAK